MGTLPLIKNTFNNKSVISIDQFDKKSISELFKLAPKMKNIVEKNHVSSELRGKIISLLFFEPSSRTFSSFATAVKRLGGQTLEYQNPMQTSSAVKGESLEDTIKVFNSYSDAIVMRHFEKGSLARAAAASSKPVINAGDGGASHPTQTLLDLYTIKERFGSLDNLKVVACGDVLHSRTIRSLVEGLCLFSGNTVYLLSPKELKIEPTFLKEMQSKGIKLIEIQKEQDIPKDANVWYWNRIQKERFANQKDAKKHIKSFVLTRKFLDVHGNKKMIIMDPLPRVGEIEEDIDQDPRALYFRNQIKNGLYVRMALLSLIFK